MVDTRATVKAMLLELEKRLPIDQALQGSILEDMVRTVIPTLDLSQYDPGSNSASGGGNTVFSPVGVPTKLSFGYKSLTSVGGAKTHIYVLDSGGIPAGEVWLFRDISITHNQGSNIDWSGRVGGGGVASISNLWFHRPWTSGVWLNALRPDFTAKNVDDQDAGDRPCILYPGSTLTIASETTIADTKVSQLSASWEVYSTAQAVTDSSGDIDGTTV